MNGGDEERSGKPAGRSVGVGGPPADGISPYAMTTTTHDRPWSDTYTGDFPPGQADEREAVTVRRVSSAGGIVTFTIRIDLNRLAGEGASESTPWHGKDPDSEQDGTSISRFSRTDSCSKPD